MMGFHWLSSAEGRVAREKEREREGERILKETDAERRVAELSLLSHRSGDWDAVVVGVVVDLL
jgi:hypothetical protein